MFDPEFVKDLACPHCVTRPVKGKSTLALGELELRGPVEAPTGLHCKDCGRVYAIDNDGIPDLLIANAKIEK
ncbi:MAG TPA: hypothetical protein VKX17_03490 [Planctomycetota bacterium]|nr:hypothetical protein [Planctomycetota bacterium]